MLTSRAAGSLLVAARSVDGLIDLARGSGLTDRCVPLDAIETKSLGIEELRSAQLGSGAGSCRVLLGLLKRQSDASLRDPIQRLARRLASRTPHVLWVLMVADEARRLCSIAAWTLSDKGGPCIAAFTWSPEGVVDSDIETLRALASCRGDDVARHAAWVEVLGRDALTRRFFRTLDVQVGKLAAGVPAGTHADDARAMAVLYATRLLFLHFLQARGWLDADGSFLADRLDECLISGGRFHHRVLLPLFFGTLNTPVSRRSPTARAFGRIPFLNGGLFTRTSLERRLGRHRWTDEHFVSLFDELFLRYRFVGREDTATWSEASVDPEMLGRAFEALMASAERKAGGVYYTPHHLVDRVTALAFKGCSSDRTQLARIRVLDPACGSGAFLVHALERLAELRRVAGEAAPIAAVRRDVLAGSIFGVDRNPTAVWLCQLRLWLSVLIETEHADPLRLSPLPNLDRNIRVGDALTGSAFSREQSLLVGGARLATMRARYARATGARKDTLARALDREERARVLGGLDRDIAIAVRCRRDLVAAERTRDLFGQRPPRNAESRRVRRRVRDRLRRLRQERRMIADGGALPISFGALFGDIQADGGFHVVIGNPPWVRLHNIPAQLRERLRESFSVFGAATWNEGASAANASRGFASQVDLAALFAERSVSLLRDGGSMALLLPSKLWRSLAGGGLRRLLLERTSLFALEDLSESRSAFDAAVYPSILAARKASPDHGCIAVAAVRGDARVEWSAPDGTIPFDASEGAPWLLLPERARAAFERLRSAGRPLASVLGSPRLGVKSGCNAAFVVRVESAARGLATIVSADGERATVEEALLRPALRGENVVRWRRHPADEHVIWTHDERGAALQSLPSRAREWLGRHYSDLSLRADARGSGRWWSLFRTAAAECTRPRVVWADFGRRPTAMTLPAGDRAVPLNTCYVMHCESDAEARALCAVLNSRVVAAWANAVAEPARGGYRRYLGWTMGLLPLPAPWERAVSLLGQSDTWGTDDALESAVLQAYGLAGAEVVALVEWQRCD